MALWIESAPTTTAEPSLERGLTGGTAGTDSPTGPQEESAPSLFPETEAAIAPALEYSGASPSQREAEVGAPVPRWDHGWPVPSSLSANPDEARACIQLPEFDPLLLEKARVISGRFPFAEAEYRSLHRTKPITEEPEIPHFEKIFRIAATIASVPNVQDDPDYDTLLILTAWHSVRPGIEGFLGSYPKSLLCPLSHSAPPAALASLSAAKQSIFERRA